MINLDQFIKCLHIKLGKYANRRYYSVMEGMQCVCKKISRKTSLIWVKMAKNRYSLDHKHFLEGCFQLPVRIVGRISSRLRFSKKKLSSPIWYNPIISKYDLFLPNWWDKNIFQGSDMVDENGDIMSLEVLKKRFDLQTNFLEYLRVQKNLKHFLGNDKEVIIKPILPLNVQALGRNKKGSKHYRHILNKTSKITENRYESK